MTDFNVRSDSVNVEHLMEQIRSRIREKRGVDYTEQQLQELANVRLESILDPRSIRSDLLEEFMKMQPASQPAEATEEAIRTSKLFDSHRGSVRFIRRLLRPILKLFFNPAPIVQVLQGGTRDPLFFQLIHNLVVETTRLGVDVKNLKMKVESLTGRLEFNERRARALESVVVYKPADEPVPSPPARSVQARTEYRPPPAFSHNAPPTPSALPQSTHLAGGQSVGTSGGGSPSAPASFPQGEGPGQRSRRRRRRRGRRSGSGGMQGAAGQPPQAASDPAPTESATEPGPHTSQSDEGSGGHEPDSQ